MKPEADRSATSARSALRKHSIAIAGHRTSISVEDAYWDGLAEIAEATDKAVATIIAEIDHQRPRGTNLSSAVRLHVLAWYQSLAAKPQP